MGPADIRFREIVMNIHLPRDICSDVQAALEREWLVTNGMGGFACGTVAGAITRRYHGLLIAALDPPVARRLLVAKLDETLHVGESRYPLYTNVWASGVEQPSGCQWLRRFDLVAGIPTWTYAGDDWQIVKRVWMECDRNLTYIQYELTGNTAVEWTGRLLVNRRDYHVLREQGRGHFNVRAEGRVLTVPAEGDVPAVHVTCSGPGPHATPWQVEDHWCRGFDLPIEAQRGFEHREDHLSAGVCTVPLAPGESLTITCTAGEDPVPDAGRALGRATGRATACLDQWRAHIGSDADAAPMPLQQLVLAADQFIVARRSERHPDGHTIIAGYPWFTDWGRDTMIALPGLTLATGRHDIARQILLTWAEHVSEGMIPNRFPDQGARPEYHTADGTLWYLWAIDQYFRATSDVDTLVRLFPVMQQIITWHQSGTRHNIRVGDDGLVHAGEKGWNLTWMDAKVNERVVTPRMGKPIELSALWYDALNNMARLADVLDQPGDAYAKAANETARSFDRFWNEETGCCRDVLDGPHGHDDSIRPNQILAVALTHSPLWPHQQEAVVDRCQQDLLTWFGLRTLAPGGKAYHEQYGGDPAERDAAYHQGTAWGWLLGSFVIANYRLHKDRAAARGLLEPLFGQLYTHGIGSLSEIFDAEEPFTPRGCIAQAWSVAEALRAWHVTQHHAAPVVV
jgi:predicted glycogen debranching enzyme